MDKPSLLSRDDVRKMVASVANHLDDYRRIPAATYRLQFNHHFTFSEATEIVSYLHDLGISDAYASPYLHAKKGSLHGYDVLDHQRLNPEVGTEGEYDRFTEALQKHGMGQMLDIVPNHMSIIGNENPWWSDILENGPSSIYADFFDIDWKPVKDELENKVLIPILGDQYGLVLENGEFRLGFEDGAFFISYYEHKLPVAPMSYTKILRYRLEELEKNVGADHPHLQEFLSIITALDHLPPRTEKDPQRILERQREKEVIKRRLWNLYHESEDIRSFLDDTVRVYNGEREDPSRFDLLDELLNDQAYRLSHWRVATEEINYRRFFDINELGAIRTEDPRVFREAHRLIFKWIREHKVTALRVDHPDGLYNPADYFRQLQKGCFIQLCLGAAGCSEEDPALEEALGRLYDEELARDPVSSLRMPFYIVGEKILIKSERMPEDWPIFSTTGYVFLNSVNGIFIQMDNGKAFDDIYTKFIGSKGNFQDVSMESKKLIMQTSMPSEINTLGHYLNQLSEKDRHTRDFTLNSLTTAITEVIANFPVYRSYVTRAGVNERDQRTIEHAVTRAKRKNPALSATIFDFLENVLLLRYPENFSETDRAEWLDFVMRFQQITGPVMAKGVEDTAFYVYNRFVSLNEVGGNPERFGTPLDTFHGQNIERTKFWPQALIATSTHDTKRGEDVRARLNVLSEMPEEWRQAVLRWSRLNKKKKTMIDGLWVPDRNEEYLLYQTLIGAWPLQATDETSQQTFKKRIREYMLKAVREAKVNTSWISVNTPYEEALLKFVDSVLSFQQETAFLRDFLRIQNKVSFFGMFNSLSQTLLKITCPGIPDFYQGTEVWDFSLVDPDNRNPVDYAVRKEMLQTLKRKINLAGETLPEITRSLVREWRDGLIKLFVTSQALDYRKEHPRLFWEGTYLPLAADDRVNEHLCAFARRWEGEVLVVVVPRFLMRFLKGSEVTPMGEAVWEDTHLRLPEEISGEAFRNVFTRERIRVEKRGEHRGLPLSQVFGHFCVALLERM